MGSKTCSAGRRSVTRPPTDQGLRGQYQPLPYSSLRRLQGVVSLCSGPISRTSTPRGGLSEPQRGPDRGSSAGAGRSGPVGRLGERSRLAAACPAPGTALCPPLSVGWRRHCQFPVASQGGLYALKPSPIAATPRRPSTSAELDAGITTPRTNDAASSSWIASSIRLYGTSPLAPTRAARTTRSPRRRGLLTPPLRRPRWGENVATGDGRTSDRKLPGIPPVRSAGPSGWPPEPAHSARQADRHHQSWGQISQTSTGASPG